MDGAQLFRHPRFLPASLLDGIRTHLESAAGELAGIQSTDTGALAVSAEVRRAWEVELPPVLHDAVIDRLEAARPDLMAHFGCALEPGSAVAALRYPPGAFYRPHRDVGAQPDAYDLHRRMVSAVVFLNDGAPRAGWAFLGGQLRFYDGPGSVHVPFDEVPAAGSLVAFPSTWLHAVLPVARGLRCSLAAWFLTPEEAGP